MQVLRFDARITQTGSRDVTFAVPEGLPQYDISLCSTGTRRNPAGSTTGLWLGLETADIHYITTFGYRHQVIWTAEDTHALV